MTKEQFSEVEERLIDTAKSVLEGRGYIVTGVKRDSYTCPNVIIKNPNGEQYPDATGAILYPSAAQNKDKFEFLFS